MSQLKVLNMKKKICEICKTLSYVDVHHIQSTSKNGLNTKNNKCDLCPTCHRLVHVGEIILEGRFLTSSCSVNETELIWRNNDEKSITETKDPDVWIIKK